MPTPVNTARQCLTPEASRALDEAVIVARRRSHTQTTSLHVISAFLSLPSSILRDACTRTRNTAYSPRIQFKALDLCFGVALDRLPSSSQNLEEPNPPISNSLMAAIKRSQANQRRNPDTFHLHQLQQQQQQSSLSCVKVELQQFILSILDDPVVSRVFGEAGFRSYEIKFAIVRPSPSLLRYTNSPYSPLFLCNLTGSDYEQLGRRSFSFPFSGGFSEISEKDGNFRRIGEVLLRKKGRNPLLVGVCAKDAIQSFAEAVESGDKGGFLPVEITDLSFICIEKEVAEFITDESGLCCEGMLGSRFEELGRLAESCSGSGVVVSFGDLKNFIRDGSIDVISYVISKLTKLLKLQTGNLWLMGAATNYEMYSRFLTKFPSIEKDWDLQLLPITSLIRPSMAGYYPRPHSLMESFVPLGGFFSTPPNFKGPLGSTFQSVSRCHLCNEKYEQEVSATLKGGSSVPVTNQYQTSLPSWLQTAELSTNKGLDVPKAKDDGTVLNTKVAGLQKKWNDICRRLHHRFPVLEGDVNGVGSQGHPRIVGFPFVTDRKHRADNDYRSNTEVSPNKKGLEHVLPSMSVELQKISPESPNMSMQDQVVSNTKNVSSLPKLHLRPSKDEHLQREDFLSPQGSVSVILDDHASPSSATSVTTNLGLGTLYSSTCPEPNKPSRAHKKCFQDLSACQPTMVDLVDRSIQIPPAQSPPCSGLDLGGQFDPRDFKTLLRGLTEKVGRQEAAIYAISRTVACSRIGKERRRGLSLKGDVWFGFLGPDYVAKKKLAVALAEMIFGDRQSLICVDLASQDGFPRANTIFDCQEINGYDANFRGKTVVDYIAGEIKKKPLSVVFLENVDKSDLLAQKCLFQAIKTGKFSDSHGREVGINNAIFVVTSGARKGIETSYSRKEPINFSEEKILEAKGWQMQILIRYSPEGTTICQKSNVLVSLSKCTSGVGYMNKRKLIHNTGNRREVCENLDTVKRVHKTSNKYLDLNILPLMEDLEGSTEEEFGTMESTAGCISENSQGWLENFFHLVDEAVVFEPYDFDVIADEILKKINESFENMIGTKGVLEIDSKVMEQILAASWLLSDTRRRSVVDYWVDQVLTKSLAKAREKYNLKAGFVLKLVTCEEGLSMEEEEEEQAPGVCLPARIILN